MKKTLSILLSALLVISTFGPMTFAETSTLPETYGNLNITAAQGADITVPVVDQGEIWAGKDVNYEGNGEFEISLLAGGKNYIVETPKPQEQYDIVLVLDRSGSMGTGSKFADMKTAAIEASTAFLGVTGNTVSIISYNDYANTNISYSSDIEDVTSAINGLSVNWSIFGGYYGGTNIQNAFLTAENLLKQRTGEIAKRKSVVILLSDGEPTYYHTSLSDHSGTRIGNGKTTDSNYVLNTVLQGQHLKDSISGLDIYTIGFDVSTNYAKDTLMPTTTSTSFANFMNIYQKSATETAQYKEISTKKKADKNWGDWKLDKPIVKINSVFTYGPSTFISIGTTIPSNTWNATTYGSPYSDIIVEEANKLRSRYATGTTTGTVYEGTPFTFAHQYWSEGSSFVSSDINALIKVFTDIVNDITNVPPNEISESEVLSDVTITDVVGDNFEIVNSAALDARADVTVVGNTVTWTIPGTALYTLLADDTTFNEALLNKLTFKVKAKEVVGTDLPTNASANATFTVDGANNPKYDSDNQTITINQKGLITLVPATGTIVENHVFTGSIDKTKTSTHTGNVGSTKTFEPISHDGYTYAITAGSATMNFIRGEQTVTFTYTPIPTYKLTVKHVKSVGGDFSEPIETTGYKTGDAYSTAPLDVDPSAFTVSSTGNVAGTFGTADIEVTYVYTPVTPIPKYTLTVSHLLSTGGNFADPVITSDYLSGATYSTSPATFNPALYTVSSTENTTGTFTDSSINVTYIYTPIPTFTLTVHHKLPNGDEFAKSSTTSGFKTGDSYNALPAIYNSEAFTLTTPANASSTFGSTNIEVTYTYTPIIPVEPTTYSLITTHTLSTGGAYAPTVTTPGFTVESNYSASPATFDPALYTVNTPGNATGYFGQGNITVNYIYTPIVINPPVIPPTTEPTPVGPQGNVNVSYVDTNGVSISPSFQFSGEVGTNYATSARAITGYTLTETPANATGSFATLTTTVTYIYSDDTVIIPEEDVAEGDAKIIDFDSFDQSIPETTTLEEVEIETEATPLADALPQTGQLPVELFYGIGGLITAAGVFLKKKK